MSLNSLIKVVCISFSSYYSLIKFIGCKLNSRSRLGLGILFMVVFILCNNLFLIRVDEPFKSIFVSIVESLLFHRLLKASLSNTFMLTTIAVAISYLLFVISCFSLSIVFALLFDFTENPVYMVIICLGQLGLLFQLSRKGILTSISFRKGVGIICLCIAGNVLIIYGVLRAQMLNVYCTCLLIAGNFLCLLGFYWIQRKTRIFQFNDKVQKQILQEKDEKLKDFAMRTEAATKDNNDFIEQNDSTEI